MQRFTIVDLKLELTLFFVLTFSGDLVVTKGDQYDVREKAPAPVTDASSTVTGTNPASGGDVINLGKPVDLARRYYESGADE